MKIFKKGDKTKSLRLIKFECDHCGCVFEASRKEYNEHLSFVVCNCPCCKKLLVIDKKDGDTQLKF